MMHMLPESRQPAGERSISKDRIRIGRDTEVYACPAQDARMTSSEEGPSSSLVAGNRLAALFGTHSAVIEMSTE